MNLLSREGRTTNQSSTPETGETKQNEKHALFSCQLLMTTKLRRTEYVFLRGCFKRRKENPHVRGLPVPEA